MKFADIIFILLVIVVLFGLTAIRYRKQIAGIIGFARMLKDAGTITTKTRSIRQAETVGINLIQCDNCSIRIPENRVIKHVQGKYYCSERCLAEARA